MTELSRDLEMFRYNCLLRANRSSVLKVASK